MTKTENQTPIASLANLLVQLDQHQDLSPVRRRDLQSSLRSFARIVGSEPGLIAFDAARIRQLLRTAHPRRAGISAKRWSNIRSDLTFLLRCYGSGRQRRLACHLADGWRQLRARIEDPQIGCGVSRFLHFCDLRGIQPGDITRESFDLYQRHLREETLVAKPERVFKRTCQLWNRAVDEIEGWPNLVVAVPVYTNYFGLPLDAFPASFRDELERWEACVSGANPIDPRAPARPLRPATVRHHRGQVLRFASALVHQGVAADKIVALAALVVPEHFREALLFFLKRGGGASRPGSFEIASLMAHIARHWVEVEKPVLDELKRIKARLQCRPRGLTARNRNRLRQFDDPGVQLAILDLPERLVTQARRSRDRSYKMALQAQTALAIALLLYVPIRLRNLVNLHMERNFVRSGRRSNQIVHLVVHESEVKNEEPIEFPLPRYLVGLLDEYLRAWRLQLVKRPDRGWLWPGRQQAPKHTSTMQMQIIDAVRRHVGVDVNVHLFRHLAAKLLLQESPGNYEGARRLLGHRSIDTTTTFYTGFDTAAAARHYHAMLEARRGRSKR